ncbi:hypothetical protein DACRYDRAFT_20670 [Dacryopinax primogenitus]|uniref:DUF202 domain-containing protein n=1 Tax=Dacryopinax primogenitus (strain DJM 731) TaxID=1858805 RepID=M5G8R6_DACPD|nr:uncharacterized protein DACRYDRAFT_20670 [Dacryopinax primogenitus]EJU05134.1 hypothetical protein DACRYDRAFT_20670 [Dacryopinax primogenitus]
MDATETTPLISNGHAESGRQRQSSGVLQLARATLQDVSERTIRLARSMHELASYRPLHVHSTGKGPKLKIEPKVWFANERTWISYLNNSILLGTLSIALYNAADKTDTVARGFAYVYAAISLLILVYGFGLYQWRITLIKRKDAGHFISLIGPLTISVTLFSAVLVNFIVRVHQIRKDRP